MPAKVIAVANMKGGVGKTTTVVALAEFLAAYGVNGKRKRVAVMDLDAQASASISIAGNDVLRQLIESGKTIDAFLEERLIHKKRSPTLSGMLRQWVSSVTVHGEPIDLSLIASAPELRFVEREVICALTQQGYGLRAIEGQTRKLVEPEIDQLKDKVDYLIVDCPPGISAFTEVMFSIADIIVTPVIADFISTRGLAAFCRSVETIASGAKLPHVLVNRFQDTGLQKKTRETLEVDAAKPDAKFYLLTTVIRQRAAIQSALENQPGETFEARWGEDGAEAYKDLATEILGKLNA
jgi:chromosome partitioning protein